jgi:hypothetical protein
MLSIINHIDAENNLEIEKLQLLDFYLLFPEQLNKFSFNRKMSKFKKYVPVENTYSSIKRPVLLFNKMESIQKLAINNLILLGFIKIDELGQEIIKSTKKVIPQKLLEKLIRSNNLTLKTLVEMSKIPLEGKNGLKERSNLIEYRYDSIK